MVRGGFGSAVLECLAENGVTGVSVKTLGLPDHFVEHGPIPTLRGLCGIDAPGVAAAAAGLMGLELPGAKARVAA